MGGRDFLASGLSSALLLPSDSESPLSPNPLGLSVPFWFVPSAFCLCLWVQGLAYSSRRPGLAKPTPCPPATEAPLSAQQSSLG